MYMCISYPKLTEVISVFVLSPTTATATTAASPCCIAATTGGSVGLVGRYGRVGGRSRDVPM